MAQAILESSWGSRAPGYNLFGIKWTKGCGHDVQTLLTTEYYRGKKTKIQAKFRKYKNYAESIDDHAKLLTIDRYKAVRQAKNYKEACYAIQKCGYATDPKYAQKLIEIIEANKLYQYDDIPALNRTLKVETPFLKGDDVKKLQEKLNCLGFKCTVDGIYGYGTMTAVQHFQAKAKLPPDGIVGPATWTKLFQV